MKNKFLIKKNNCILCLNEVESGFLYNNVRNNLSINNIEKVLVELYINSKARYYSLSDVSDIAISIKEEIGRHVDSDTATGNFTIIKLLSEKGIHVSDGIDHNSGKEMLTINVNNKSHIKYFDSPASVHVYLSNLYSKFM